ncbi:hypothetical protein D9613_000541 [Agrocybe pediades]|uniref:Clathrin/coatomer adaptor adaptin-like N-terminal domain-containing protein n=1 Tax=Agrocybe pediades TaxID=84607 RepID=A0A8H4R1Z7_9AGAR|nr:hypothetical protein D9613_000541 [Agrocybe pediades]
MDIPFHSSGALSRAHYTIVRKVESAPTVQSADQHIFLEIKSTHIQLSHPKLTLDKCKECLVILLYCYHTVTPGFLPPDAFDFAFPHAINMAEAGRTIEEKRLGYLVCSEMMPLEHELRLMLINTLRKDIESDDIPLICMALDNLIISPNEDVIPAVQSHLHDLLAHDHPQVRRRTLFAFRALSTCDRALLDRIHGSIIDALRDHDYSVVKAALILAEGFPKDALLSAAVNELFKTEVTDSNHMDEDIILNLLQAFRKLELTVTSVPLVYDILQRACRDEKSNARSQAVIQAVFATLSQISSSVLINLEKSTSVSSVGCIRHLLVSHNPNDVHLFVACLEQLEASCWAGTSPEYEPVLDALEFERIMQLLNYPDEEIARKVLRVVNKVDPAILEAQISLLMEKVPEPAERGAFTSRVLNIAFTRYALDGGEYARQVIELARHLEAGLKTQPVFKEVIELALNHAHLSEHPGFLTSFSDYLIEQLINEHSVLGPTTMVIAAALLTEVAKALPSPGRILSSLASRLSECPTIVQEPLLISMIRLRAECSEVPASVAEAVKGLAQSKHRSTKLRCTQFLNFYEDKEALIQIVNNLPSSSLPDFLIALESHRPPHSSESVRSSSPYSRSSSRSTRPVASLKYAAYAQPELPHTAFRISGRKPTPHQGSSDGTAGALPDSTKRNSPSLSLSAGHLALANSFNDLHLSEELHDPSGPNHIQPEARTDLINLESPFTMDASMRHESVESLVRDEDFEELWNLHQASCDLRGWCNTPIDDLTRRLQRVKGRHLRVISADLAPFIGELKVEMIVNGQKERSSAILLRLRESEEESCLWRLRCSDVRAGEEIERVLSSS